MEEYLDLNGYEDQEQITYAHTRQRAIIHISEAVSGKKGYYCIGCSKELQARKGEINMHHFAHDPAEIKKRGGCSFNNETYRHQLAKSILLNLKQITVPDVCKYPPLEIQGETFLLRSARVITAHTAQQEIQFYEDESGQLQYGQNIHFTPAAQKHLLIQPDVVFFDETGKPILLVEMVATHRISDEKWLKIRRLGIDTVLVNVPKGTLKDIENAFFNPQKIKWVYNNEQEQTDYLSISKGNYPRVSLIDEWERSLIQSIETAKCTKIRITNLIRTIGKCLESESYRIAEQAIRQQISSVEENTARARNRMQTIGRQYAADIEKEVASRRGSLEAAYRTTEQDIRTRTDQKGAELDKFYQQITTNHQSAISRLDRIASELGGRRSELERKQEETLRAEFDRIETNIRHEIEQTETLAESAGEKFRAIQAGYSTNSGRKINAEADTIDAESRAIDAEARRIDAIVSKTTRETSVELERITRFQDNSYKLLGEKFRNIIQELIQKGSDYRGTISDRTGSERNHNLQLSRKWKKLQRTIESDDHVMFEMGTRKINEIAQRELRHVQTEEAISRTIEREQPEINNIEQEQTEINLTIERNQEQINRIEQEQIAIETERRKLETDFSNTIATIEEKRIEIEQARSVEQARFNSSSIERNRKLIGRNYQNQFNAIRAEQSVISTATDNLERDFKNAIDAIERKRATIETIRSREQDLIAKHTASFDELRNLESQEQRFITSNTTSYSELQAKIEKLERDEDELTTFRRELSLASPKGDVCFYPRLQARFEELLSALQNILLLGESQKGIRRIRKAQEAFELGIYKKWR